MHIDFLLKSFEKNSAREAIVWKDQITTYGELLEEVNRSIEKLRGKVENRVVAIEGDFSPRATAILLALIELECIVVPLTDSVAAQKDEFKSIAEVEATIKINPDDSFDFQIEDQIAQNPMIAKLKSEKHPGLILFSSGSTGKSKAALHDFLPLLEKFKTPRKSSRMITFLLFDHIGGINTLFSILSSSGTIITLESRKPDEVCRAIEKYRAEILPTSPTFINLLLLSEAYRDFDLSSLTLMTYGTEPMPESTLARCHEIFPNVKLKQTYGLSEIGIMRSKSKSSDSLWMKIGGEDFETRVVDGLLEIKSKSAMLGYLNAPSPFTDDGFFKTGDAVLVDGEYFRILGRQSEMINVGGQKVFPAEIESILEQIPGVEEVTVSGEKNLLTGQIIKARVKLSTDESVAEFKKRMRSFCRGRIENFKIPQKIEIVTESLHGDRFKKIRRD